MGKNVNALLVIVYEYYRVTTAQENQHNVVLYLFYVFFSTLTCPCCIFLVLILPFHSCFRFALNSFDMLLTFILIL